MRQRLVLAVLSLALTGLVHRPALAEDTVGVFVVPTHYTLLERPNDDPKLAFHHGHTASYGWEEIGAVNIPFAGDFDGDGWDSIGYYNQREGLFYFSNANQPGTIDYVVEFHPAGYPTTRLWPVVLNYTAAQHENNRTIEVGVYDETNNRWYLEGYNGYFTWGWDGTSLMTSIPVVGDWDGDGDVTLGLYNRTLKKFRIHNAIPPSGNGTPITFGDVDVFPVAGNWDGDLADEVGFYDWSTQTFHLRNDAGNDDDSTVFTEAILDNFTDTIAHSGILPVTAPLAGRWDTGGNAEPAPFDWPEEPPSDHGLTRSILEDATVAAEAAGHVNSLLVVRDRYLVWEEYFNGYGPTSTNNLKSVSKSILSALFGIAGKVGCIPDYNPTGDPIAWLNLIQMNALLDDGVGSCGEDEYCGFDDSIKLKHMMTMTAGFEWDDDFPLGWADGPDWIGFIDNDQQTHWHANELGTYVYNSGLTHIGADILRRYSSTTDCDSGGYADIFEFAREELFTPLGIPDAVTRWDHEPETNDLPANTDSPIFTGGFEMFIRPRDLARFGQLYLDEGTIDGTTEILHAEWVDKTTKDQVGGSKQYGAWWVRECLDDGIPPADDPRDCFGIYNDAYAARGHAGQHIFIFPSLEMQVIMTSDWSVGQPAADAQVVANEAILATVLSAVIVE